MRHRLWLAGAISLSIAGACASGPDRGADANGPPSGVVTSFETNSASPIAVAPPSAASADEPSSPGQAPVRVFARAHTGPLLLPNQPPTVRPADQLTHYRIDQRVDDVAATLSGEVVIRFSNPTGKPLNQLPLMLHANSAMELGVAANDSGRIDVIGVQRLRDGAEPRTVHFDQKRPTLVEVALGDPVAPNEAVTIRVAYEGKLRQLSSGSNDMMSQVLGSMASLTGGGSADYGLLAIGDGIVTAASAYPMVAPYRQGSFDIGPPAKMGDIAYNDVATFEVTTRVPRGMLLVSNLVDDTPGDAEGGWTKVVSQGSHVRDFVLVGGRDLQRTSQKVGDTLVTSVFRSGDGEAGKRVLAMASSSLQSYERRFGPYPYSELDAVEATLVGGAGGVEFNAMVLIAGMLYRNPLEGNPLLSMLGKSLGGGANNPLDAVTEQLSMTLDFTVAHEVAHQYFAGIVGNDSQRYPSLDEPIAQFAAGLAFEDRYGAIKAKRAMDSNVKLNYAVYRMMGGADKAVLRDTKSFATAVEYAGLVYGKAPYVYVALRQKLGDKRLTKAIHDAVDANRFALATTDEWIASLEKGAGGPSSGVRKEFDRWLSEAHGDADLGVNGSGDFVMKTMLPPSWPDSSAADCWIPRPCSRACWATAPDRTHTSLRLPRWCVTVVSCIVRASGGRGCRRSAG